MRSLAGSVFGLIVAVGLAVAEPAPRPKVVPGPAGLPLAAHWKVSRTKDGSLTVPFSFVAVRRFYDDVLAGRPGLRATERRTPAGREATLSWISSPDMRTTAIVRERAVSTEIKVSLAADATTVKGRQQRPQAGYVLEPNVKAVREAANGITDDHLRAQRGTQGR
jgi:hypothetical protein